MSRHSFLKKKDEEILREFDLQILAIKSKKINYLKTVARRKGIIAEKLEDLKSNCGNLFKEIERKDFTGGYRKAMAGDLETAYFCPKTHIDGCGWVKGFPRSERYNDIGSLGGSAGTRFYCQICGKLIEECKLVIS